MSDTPDPITLQEVGDALAELKVGRSRARGRRYIRSILHRYGDGARHINELDPKFYPAVFAAAGGDIISAVKFYGAVVDLPATITIPTPEQFFGVVLDVPTRPAKSAPPPNRKSPTRPILRLRSPLVADLEAKLKARAGMPRSKPTMHVDLGNASRSEDQRDDAPQPEYPAGTRMS